MIEQTEPQELSIAVEEPKTVGAPTGSEGQSHAAVASGPAWPHGDATATRNRSPAEFHPLARLPEEWAALFDASGEKAYRAKQVFRWLHSRGVLDPRQMTDLSLGLRERLVSSGVSAPATVVHVHRSNDRTRKLVLEMGDQSRVECVLIPMTPSAERADADLAAISDDEDDEDGSDAQHTRVTLCLSTQHGCAMGCTFCASGRAGLKRALGAAEITSQVLLAKQHLESGEVLRNLVFMGMGEPLHHYEETARAIRLLTHSDGLNLSPRRITVSTVGLVPGIRRLGQDFQGKVGLAISLHAPDDATRDRLVPMNRRYSIGELLLALKEYPLPKRRRITIEYTLIDGVNDSIEQARALARILRPLRVKVNLIPWNPIDNSPLAASSGERVEAFREVLVQAGYSCFLRTRRGDSVSAACGQLAMKRELPVLD